MRWVLAGLTALLLWLQGLLWFGEGGLNDVRELSRSVEAQRQEVDRLRQRNQALEAEVNDLKTGLEALEERARSELGMIRKGETFYQIIEREDDAR
ncbi:cell division protein FtsB [Alkalilimnicola ehrlichii]|uniref:cell division protein FtsB n=1 Tax=Alkalilimnicola ehrlichii TaxID=351052 RepID=UPI003BA1D601